MRKVSTRVASLIVVSLLIGACASVPIKQKAVISLQAAEQALGNAQDAERQLCAPGVGANTPVTACTSPAAATVGLTTERHQAIARALSAAFDAQIKSAIALRAWKAGDPAPSSLADYQRVTNEAIVVVRQLVSDPKVNGILTDLQNVLNAIATTVSLIQGA